MHFGVSKLLGCILASATFRTLRGVYGEDVVEDPNVSFSSLRLRKFRTTRAS